MCREISLQSDNNVHCENLIRPALIRADETLSHFSRRLGTKGKGFDRTASGEKSNFSLEPFLPHGTILRNSYCTLEPFCVVQFCRGGHILLGRPCGEEHFAGWQKSGRVAWPYGSWGCSGKTGKNGPASLNPEAWPARSYPGGQHHSHVTCMRDVFRRKQDYIGNIPILGPGYDK